jgi:hypothetical protein
VSLRRPRFIAQISDFANQAAEFRVNHAAAKRYVLASLAVSLGVIRAIVAKELRFGNGSKGLTPVGLHAAQRQECAKSGHYRQRGERIESTLGCTRSRLFVQPDQLLARP